MKARRFGAGLAVLLAACGGQSRSAQPPLSVASFNRGVPKVGARVRIIVPSLGPGWRVGMFQRTRQEPPCFVVLLFSPRSNAREVEATVYIRAAVRLQVSSLYDAEPERDPDPAASGYEGETWRDNSLDSAAASGANCPDTIERAH